MSRREYRKIEEASVRRVGGRRGGKGGSRRERLGQGGKEKGRGGLEREWEERRRQ